ncbi:MAG: LLM class flavin-dependent oxidoreductase [Sphingobium sp.]
MPYSYDRKTNPIFGDHPFKLGLFGYLHQGGMALTKAPERWQARWEDIAAMARMADEGGLDYLVPISSWKGWKGEIDQRRWSYETLTHAAALSGITKRIGLFATVHAPLIHPVFVAKALATIDHASGGRAGLNIVCGWNKADFDMFGVEPLAHDERYDHGLEWFEILSKLLAEGNEDFDYSGEYFKDLKAVSGEPGSIQQPHPAIISAAYSPVGREFAIKTSDHILTMGGNLDSLDKEIADIRAREAKAGRTTPLGVIGTLTITCRETRREAEEFNEYYAVQQRDAISVEQFISARSTSAASPEMSVERQRMGAAGGGLIVGTPEDVVEGLIKMKNAGLAGATLTTLNFLDDLPLIINRVLPLMEEAGLRNPVMQAAE